MEQLLKVNTRKLSLQADGPPSRTSYRFLQFAKIHLWILCEGQYVWIICSVYFLSWESAGWKTNHILTLFWPEGWGDTVSNSSQYKKMNYLWNVLVQTVRPKQGLALNFGLDFTEKIIFPTAFFTRHSSKWQAQTFQARTQDDHDQDRLRTAWISTSSYNLLCSMPPPLTTSPRATLRRGPSQSHCLLCLLSHLTLLWWLHCIRSFNFINNLMTLRGPSHRPDSRRPRRGWRLEGGRSTASRPTTSPPLSSHHCTYEDSRVLGLDFGLMQWIPPYKFQPSFFSFLFPSTVFKTVLGICG